MSRDRKRLRVGVLDLVANRPVHTPYSRLVHPSFMSIMPQAVAAWAAAEGHRVSYLAFIGHEDLESELPDDLDVLFVSGFSSAAYLAYAVARRFRQRGTVTVLGGPHARAYPHEAARFFDYVVETADAELVRDLLSAPHQLPEGGAVLSAKRPLADLPGVRERWPFARTVLEKGLTPGVLASLASLGCPYQCRFCVDATVAYKTLPREQILEDLGFVQQVMRVPAVSWQDPNFAVRFDETLDVIEEAAPDGGIKFIAESSLSILDESRLARLQRNGFVAMFVGIESWYGFNDKVRQRGKDGSAKLDAIVEQAAAITRHIPYTQTNFVWGLDEDAEHDTFGLTREFVERVPGAFPSHSIATAFGDASPMGLAARRAGRILDVPFQYLDGSWLHNMRLLQGSAAAFYRGLADVVGHSYSRSASLGRFRANPHGPGSAGRWMALVRSLASARRARYYAQLAESFATDPEYQRFELGGPAPAFFRAGVRRQLGRFYAWLPAEVIAELEREVPLPTRSAA